MSIGLSFQVKKLKLGFQDGGHGGYLGFWIRTILAIFALQDTLVVMLLTSFKSIGLSVQENKQKIVFQNRSHGGHLGFPIGTILAIFIYIVTCK